MAAKHNLVIDQGSTFRQTLTWSAGKPAVLVDLTGCTAKAQFRETIESASILHELSSTAGTIIIGGADGKIELVIAAETSSAWNWTSAVWDLEISFPNGSKRRLLQGRVQVNPEVTRD